MLSMKRRRSWPSRVRSPTPEKTETPPCSRATLWISSWIRTVFPTPAPPNKPTLPPLTYGAIRSMTLIPVSKISTVGWRSLNSGGSRWIGQRSVPSGAGSFLSIGSPITFQSRPSVVSPTGTVIGPPVSTTSAPRASPSVESIATARTRSSPRCCWTSAMRLIAGRPSCSGASGMRLLEGGFRGRTRSAKALQKPRQCIEARCDVAHPSEPCVPLERRHPGGVVEASAVRGDERRDHTRTVPARRLSLRATTRCSAAPSLGALRAERRHLDERVGPEHRRAHAPLLRDVAVVGVHDVDRRRARLRARRRQVQERAEAEDDRGGARGGRAHPARRERQAPTAGQRERLVQLLQRSRPDEPGRGHRVGLQGSTAGAAREVRLQHLLGELGELAVEPERDPLAAALADHVVSRYEPHYPI